MSEEKTVLAEFIEEFVRVENEQKLLATEKRELIADYKDKLDMKAVQAAIRIVKLRAKLETSDEELENLVAALERQL